MSDHSIPWTLLQDWEEDFFKSRGVDLHRSGILFNRELSQDDLRDVLALLLSLRRRISTPDESHINFAIGDCATVSAEWFGEDITEELCREVLEWFPKRDNLLLFAASVLIYIQNVERLIKVCCATLDRGLSVEDLLSNNKKAQQATMGRLRMELERHGLFSPEYDRELKEFVINRNCFVHSLWTVELPEMLRGNKDCDSVKLCGQFIVKLLHQAQKCDRIFKGAIASLGVRIPELSSTGFSESTLWIRYTAEFEEARRKN